MYMDMDMYMYVYVYMYMYMYMYMHMHMHMYMYMYGTTYYTPEITKVKFHRKMPLNIHWTTAVTIHWESEHPLEHTAYK